MVLKLIKDDKLDKNMSEDMFKERNKFVNGVSFIDNVKKVILDEDGKELNVYYENKSQEEYDTYKLFLYDYMFLMNNQGQTIERIK